ncbi:MAG: hypothetical protein ACRBM6_32920 [Geminicoccales bacterium]
MRRRTYQVGAGIMTATGYAIQMTERTSPSPGENEVLSLIVLYDEKPIGSVTMEWHGDLELSFSSSKFFGGKSPGIDNAWQLAGLVFRAITAEDGAGITRAAQAFTSENGEDIIWQIQPAQPPAGGVT